MKCNLIAEIGDKIFHRSATLYCSFALYLLHRHYCNFHDAWKNLRNEYVQESDNSNRNTLVKL